MAPRLMERRELPNGVTLEFWDESRKVVGDRWYVGVRAVVPVPLLDHQVDHVAPEVVEVVRTEVGENLCFQLREQKNFVAEAEVDALREEFKRVFLSNSLPYLSRPDFPSRFVSSKLREAAEKMKQGKEYVEKFLNGLRRPAPHP
ncbi:MAG TPA: hypothetical protein VES58_07130 [Syntrophobacteria bacterium]|nr:hypothetical protein [Syntrophobacteria bacterium]